MIDWGALAARVLDSMRRALLAVAVVAGICIWLAFMLAPLLVATSGGPWVVWGFSWAVPVITCWFTLDVLSERRSFDSALRRPIRKRNRNKPEAF